MSKLHRIIFSLEPFPNCCGIGIFSDFRLERNYTGGFGTGKPRKLNPGVHKTEKEAAEDCYKRMLNRVGEDGYTTFSLALIWKDEMGFDPQFPELHKILEKDWQYVEFQNPNTWNTLRMYTRHFPEAVEQAKADRNEEDW